LTGVEGRIDHIDFDAARQRLFVCALGNNSVEVIDLRKGERVRSITGLGAPQGIAYVPGVDRLFVANDEGGVLKIYDGESFKPLGEVSLGDDADNIRYDEVAKRVYVGFGNGGIAIISASDGRQIGSIELQAHPESFQLERSSRRMFVNVPNSRHVAVVDRDQGKVIAAWKTDPAFANFPMALDETGHRLFIGCRKPSKLLVIDTESGNIVGEVGISGDCDDVFYDKKRHRVYAVCGAGETEIIEESGQNVFKSAAQIGTAPGARTGLFVPELNTLFVAVPRRGSSQAEIRAYQVEKAL
jgi:DNA-binding beta-propeller fold protein YncE